MNERMCFNPLPVSWPGETIGKIIERKIIESGKNRERIGKECNARQRAPHLFIQKNYQKYPKKTTIDNKYYVSFFAFEIKKAHIK